MTGKPPVTNGLNRREAAGKEIETMAEAPNTDTHSDPGQKGEGDRGQDGNGDAKTVPLEALEAERRKRQERDREVSELQQRLARLEGAVSASSNNGSKNDEPKEYTRAELRRAVENGSISEDEMDDILDRQREQRAQRIAREEADKSVSEKARATTIQQDLDAYMEVEPALKDRDSEVFKRVASEYRYLRDRLGRPADNTTELEAVRAALGPLGALKQAKANGRDREHHQETGGGGPSRGESEEKGPKWPKGTSERFKAYYQRKIDNGEITKEKAIERLKNASPKVQRAAGMVA